MWQQSEFMNYEITKIPLPGAKLENHMVSNLINIYRCHEPQIHKLKKCQICKIGVIAVFAS